MKKELVLHIVLVILETISLVYLLTVEGPAVFRYYTVLSNMLMFIVSSAYLLCFAGRKEIPEALSVLHLMAAVCLTVTFIIAAFVLMPQSTFAYYFLDNVAPILHFIGPVLSVVTFMMSDVEIPKYAVVVPASLSLLYGFVALLLNAAKLLKGPYFFLEVYSTPAGTIVMWFVIIFILCVALTAAYMFIHSKIMSGAARKRGEE